MTFSILNELWDNYKDINTVIKALMTQTLQKSKKIHEFLKSFSISSNDLLGIYKAIRAIINTSVTQNYKN